MYDVVVRLTILLLVSVCAVVLVCSGRRFIVGRRRRMLGDVSFGMGKEIVSPLEGMIDEYIATSRVHILAFSSEDCRQCHQFQAPVLRRILEARGELVSVTDIDAPSTPALTERYQVLTVPTTVLLDARGKAHAVNYGFTNAQSLLKQVDEILAMDEYVEVF